MKITFLGTNGWYDTREGNTACVLVDTKDQYIVFDAGNGLYKLDRYIKKDKPIYLFLSHLHIDHIEGLHVMLKFRFKRPINILCPAGFKKSLRRFVNWPFTKPIDQQRPFVRLVDLSATARLPFGLEYKRLEHPVACYGYRVKTENKSVAYCTDTGFCDNLVKLMLNTDLSIVECSYKLGTKVDPKWSHLNPELAARAATESSAKKLLLTHFDASMYLTKNDRLKAQAIARKTFKQTSAAFDDMIVTL
jgi:ribonuclease BN (tRNA processing enzyme)